MTTTNPLDFEALMATAIARGVKCSVHRQTDGGRYKWAVYRTWGEFIVKEKNTEHDAWVAFLAIREHADELHKPE